jgi:hypothetical protein
MSSSSSSASSSSTQERASITPPPYLYSLICINPEFTRPSRMFFVSHDLDLTHRVLVYLRDNYPPSDRIMQSLTLSGQFPILRSLIIDDDDIKKRISAARVRHNFIYLRSIDMNHAEYTEQLNTIWPSRRLNRIRRDLSNNEIV